MKNIKCECLAVAQKLVDRFGGEIIEGCVYVAPVTTSYREVMDFSYSIPRHVFDNGNWVPCH